MKSRVYVYLDMDAVQNGIYRLLLDYTDIAHVKAVIEKIANAPTLTVDNDFGTILSGSEFVARCRADEAWDWRQRYR
jgi:hypothetical protein